MMIWAAVSFYGPSELMIIKGKKESKRYFEILEQGLLPFAAEVFGEQTTWMFYKDNCPTHVSAFTRNWRRSNSVTIIQ